MFGTIRSFFAPPLTGDPAQSTAKILWLVRVRWLAISAQLLSIVPALAFEVLEPTLLPHFVAVISVLGGVNAATWMWVRGRETASQGHVLVQLVADITALSILLGLSGGAWNPLVPILFVHSVIGAMLLQGQYSLIMIGVMTLCLGLLQTNSHIPPRLAGSLLPATILFPAQFLVALVFWIMTAWLSNNLSAMQSHITESRERKTRIDRLRAVGALAAGIAHEFATPLNTAQLRLARLARTQQLDDDTDLQTAREELERCGEVLRHMAGSQLDPERLDLETVAVDQLARRVCDSFSKVHQDVELRFRVEGRGPRRALLPSVAFSQALINLIDNAVESAGSESPVDVVVRSHAGRVELMVADQGEGWPNVVLSHLGEPFVTTKPDGVGLGLYYVHSLSEAMGAELTLEDRAGGGAIARISLPEALTGEPGGQEVEA
jgi:two-component system sensor histidine kinase RegB